MDKKVIEPVVIKQEAEDNIRIEKRSTRTCISQIEVCGWKENKVSVDDATRTEVAKAICPKYQETEDENKILKEQIESIFKNANDKVSLLEQRYAKVLEALKMHVDSLDLSNMEFYEKYGFNVADVFPRTRQLIQQSETK